MLKIFLLVVCAVGGICAGGERGPPSSPQLTQEDAQTILRAQTALRRYLIQALANLHEYLDGFHPFRAAVTRILQGLRSRDLDPLKTLRTDSDSNSNQSAAYRMATIICSMQGCSPSTLTEWRSFLQTIPHMTDLLPPPPIIPLLTPTQLHKASTHRFPDAALLLLHQNHLEFTNRLLHDVLYNYPFRNHSPDLDMAIDALIRKLRPPTNAFRPEQTSAERPDEILSDIVRFVLRRQQPQDRLEFETAAVLSALSDRENVEHLRGGSTPWELLELVRDDDYPPDVVRAARDLAAAVKNNRVQVAAGSLKGYSPMEKLLGVISQLSGLPGGDPLSGLVHGIYPHVKLRYLSSKGRFFHPQTSSDVAFLLNSFLTVPGVLLLGEVHNIFLLPEFDWRGVLGTFDYSKYSKPRSLLMDMLQELLRNSDRLPACDLILLSHFLSNYSKVPNCHPYEFDDDVVGEKLRGATKPLRLVPDLQEKHPTAALKTSFPKCSHGPTVEMVDPDSIIEIFNSNATLVFDLIRFNPMPADRYPNKTRLAVLRAVLNDLRAADAVVEQALMRMPLNEKANSPPRYRHLCPSESNAVISQAGQQTFRDVAATSNVTLTPLKPVAASTTASSLLVSTAATTQPSTFLSSVLATASSRPSSPPAAAAVTAFPITTASSTTPGSPSSTPGTSTTDSLSADTTVTVSPTALFSHFLKSTSAFPFSSSRQPTAPTFSQNLPAQAASSSPPDDPAPTPAEPPSRSSSFPDSTP